MKNDTKRDRIALAAVRRELANSSGFGKSMVPGGFVAAVSSRAKSGEVVDVSTGHLFDDELEEAISRLKAMGLKVKTENRNGPRVIVSK
jgi:hypothetical protein